MSFTDRYIKIPIRVYDAKQRELTDNEEEIDSSMMINPFKIESYRRSLPDKRDESETVAIVTDSGDSTTVYMSLEKFENLLNNFLLTNKP
jgi:hypothetical protein